MKTITKAILTISLLIPIISAFATSPQNSKIFTCSGEEPFWNISIDKNVVILKHPEMANAEIFFDARKMEAYGYKEGTAFEISASNQKGKNKIQLTFVRAECTDSADITHPYHVVVKMPQGTLSGGVLMGCCE